MPHHAIPMQTAMPCHLHCQPCHAINNIATLRPFTLTAIPMPFSLPCLPISAKHHLPYRFNLQTGTTAQTARCHNFVPSPWLWQRTHKDGWTFIANQAALHSIPFMISVALTITLPSPTLSMPLCLPKYTWKMRSPHLEQQSKRKRLQPPVFSIRHSGEWHLRLCHLFGMPRTQLCKMLSDKAMEWKEDLHTKERAGEAHLPQRTPNWLQFPNHGGMSRHLTPVQTYLLRMWGIRAWCPALSSDTEELSCSPLTSWRHGVDSRRDTTYLGDMQICILALQRVSTSESLVYSRLTSPLIVLSLISIPRSTKRLWKQNSRKEDTWALSWGLSSSPLLDLSNICIWLIFLKQLMFCTTEPLWFLTVEKQTPKPKFKTLFKQSENLRSIPENQIITNIGTKLNNFADLLGLNSYGSDERLIQRLQSIS